jgi:hypothetical protein
MGPRGEEVRERKGEREREGEKEREKVKITNARVKKRID